VEAALLTGLWFDMKVLGNGSSVLASLVVIAVLYSSII